MAVQLPTPPLGTPLANKDGTPSEAYNRFFLSIDESAGTFAPNLAEYFVSRANADLPNEVNLGALTTGYLKITVASAIATPSTTATIPISDLTGVLPAANGGTGTATPTGVYTPTATPVVNVTSTTMSPCQWMRVSDMVTVSGRLEVTPTGAGTSQFEIDLPVASNFSQVYQCAGAGAVITAVAIPVAVQAVVANDTALITLTAPDATSRTFSFSFTYRVI